MRLLTLLVFFVLVMTVLSSASDEEEFRSPRSKRFSLSKKFKFWFNRGKDKEDENTERKKKSFGQKIKDGWTKFKSWVKKYKNKKHKRYQMKKEDAKSQLPRYLRDKYAQGKKVFQSELDEAYFKMMKERRRGVSIIDIINSINRGNDVNLRQVDIVEPKDAPKELENTGSRSRRDVMRERFYLWHDRVIPYEIKDFQSTDVNAIKTALNGIESRTCLKFVPRTTETNWIQYFRGAGCYSNVGKVFWQEGFQQISLGYGCMTKGTIQHETMHALGFYHEQARPDRDQYVKIFFDNIPDDQEHNFEKQTKAKADTLDIQYDFSSVMHYGKFSFAQDPSKPTILPIQNPNQEIGQRDAVSDTDIEQINILYSCSVSGGGWSKWSDYGACNVDCIKQRSRFCMNTDKTSCPNPTNSAYNRYGVDLQETRCSSSECAGVIDGNWGSWGDWGECSETCGTGKHTRNRQCNNPSPQNGGKSCEGSGTEEKECFIKPCNSGSLDCTFDDNSDPLCGWTSDESMDSQWTRNSGSTPSTSTGPSSDKTSGSGFYMYIETSSPAREGWKARLTSQLIGAAVVNCMKFSYHMYGASMGTLNVIVKSANTEQIFFKKSGNQGNEWQTVEVTIQNSNPYKIVIEGVRGSDWQGDIAIDDVEFTNGACVEKVITTPSPTPTILRVGCYQDQGYINGRRPFTHRGDLSNLAISTNQLSELRNHYYDVVRYCGSLARNNGFKFFAIQQYYECWTGPTSDVLYSRDGESQGCWPEQQMGYGPHIVGQYLSNMVYQWSDLE